MLFVVSPWCAFACKFAAIEPHRNAPVDFSRCHHYLNTVSNLDVFVLFQKVFAEFFLSATPVQSAPATRRTTITMDQRTVKLVSSDDESRFVANSLSLDDDSPEDTESDLRVDVIRVSGDAWKKSSTFALLVFVRFCVVAMQGQRGHKVWNLI